MKLGLCILFSCCCFILSAQESTLSDSSKREVNKALIYYQGVEKPQKVEQADSSIRAEKPLVKGSLTIIEEDSLFLLVDGYKEQKQLEGYKIQIFSGRSRMDAVKVKSSFLSKYGENESADILYQQPNFKIRVGNYRDRLSAHKWLAVYKIDFPSSFIVKDVVKIDE